VSYEANKKTIQRRKNALDIYIYGRNQSLEKYVMKRDGFFSPKKTEKLVKGILAFHPSKKQVEFLRDEVEHAKKEYEERKASMSVYGGDDPEETRIYEMNVEWEVGRYRDSYHCIREKLEFHEESLNFCESFLQMAIRTLVFYVNEGFYSKTRDLVFQSLLNMTEVVRYKKPGDDEVKFGTLCSALDSGLVELCIYGGPEEYNEEYEYEFADPKLNDARLADWRTELFLMEHCTEDEYLWFMTDTNLSVEAANPDYVGFLYPFGKVHGALILKYLKPYLTEAIDAFLNAEGYGVLADDERSAEAGAVLSRTLRKMRDLEEGRSEK